MRHLFFQLSLSLVAGVCGCATTPEQKVRNGFELTVDKSVSEVKNIRFHYGDLGWMERAGATAGGGSTWRMEMIVPENFEISWETIDGTPRRAVIPVKTRLPGSVKDKTVLFLIMQDHVEAYLAVSTPSGQMRERFY